MNRPPPSVAGADGKRPGCDHRGCGVSIRSRLVPRDRVGQVRQSLAKRFDDAEEVAGELVREPEENVRAGARHAVAFFLQTKRQLSPARERIHPRESRSGYKLMMRCTQPEAEDMV